MRLGAGKPRVALGRMAARGTLDGFVTRAPPAKRAKVGAAAGAGGGAGAGDGEGGAGDGPPQLEGLSEEQRRRVLASRALALAKSYTRQADEAAYAARCTPGGQPGLADLLLEPSWKAALGTEMRKTYFAELEQFVQSEWRGATPVYPEARHVFRAFNSCPVDRVKVVVLGQDPYHGPGQAVGLSFAVPPGERVPPSLQNIYKELATDVAGFRKPGHGDLEKWAAQGVLLLNATLTVRKKQAGSHQKKGWEVFTDAAVRHLSQHRSGLVFLLWGKFAQDRARVVDKGKHHILKSVHPSGLSAHRGFFGCGHFSKANALLKAAGQEEIDWQL